jgi:hypothetical protein
MIYFGASERQLATPATLASLYAGGGLMRADQARELAGLYLQESLKDRSAFVLG